MFNKTLGVHISYEADLRQVYGDDVFDTVVPLAKDFKEAVILRQPVGHYRPKSPRRRSSPGSPMNCSRGSRRGSVRARGGLPEMNFKANDEARRNRLASMTDSQPMAEPLPPARSRASSRAGRNSARRACSASTGSSRTPTSPAASSTRTRWIAWQAA